MMLNGKKIKAFCVVILIVSVLFLACCNRNNIYAPENTTKEEIKQPVTTIKEEYTEKTVDKIPREEITSIKEKVEISITVMNNSGDNQIIFDFSEERESLNIDSTTMVSEEFAQNQTTTKETVTQQIQAVTEPATDSEGWVIKWY